MIRNLKVLGLALVAMLTMGVASASAAEFHSEASSTAIKGTQSTTNTFSTHSGTIHCTTATFEGSASGFTTPNVIVEPKYSGCQSTGFIKANVTVDTNGCDYNITATGEVHLETCEAGKTGIVVTAPFCTITVPQNQTLSEVTFSETGVGTTTEEVVVAAKVSNISYNESGFACAKSGTNTTGGTYEGSVTTTGSSAGSHVGISHG